MTTISQQAQTQQAQTQQAHTKQAQRLIAHLGPMKQVAVAFSGGVDSSVVAAAARQAGLKTAIAVTAKSPSLSSRQLAIAIEVANQIGIPHKIIETREGALPEYRRNDGQRCFFCKQTLYSAMIQIATEFPGMQIVSGTNADDLSDYRPGLQAGSDADVRTPLADLGIGKAEVRGLASHFGLSNHDLPAAPCLASRVAYGTEVTEARLKMIEQAECWLHERGFDVVRVRLHPDDLASIEVPKTRVAELQELDRDSDMRSSIRTMGFRSVVIDEDGFRSGNLNQLLVNLSSKPDRVSEVSS